MCIFNKKRVNSTSEVKNMDKISVVVPCYNEEEALPVYYKEMCRVMDEMKDICTCYPFHFPETLERKLRFMQD